MPCLLCWSVPLPCPCCWPLACLSVIWASCITALHCFIAARFWASFPRPICPTTMNLESFAGLHLHLRRFLRSSCVAAMCRLVQECCSNVTKRPILPLVWRFVRIFGFPCLPLWKCAATVLPSLPTFAPATMQPVIPAPSARWWRLTAAAATADTYCATPVSVKVLPT